jgi:hypothetical protein
MKVCDDNIKTLEIYKVSQSNYDRLKFEFDKLSKDAENSKKTATNEKNN